MLALYVVQSDEDAVIKYVAGLNPEVRYAAIHVAGWTEATTVAEKPMIVIQSQRIVDGVSVMGGKQKKTIYQHPNSTNPIQFPVQIVKPTPPPQNAVQPMEIDAISTQRRNAFPAI